MSRVKSDLWHSSWTRTSASLVVAVATTGLVPSAPQDQPSPSRISPLVVRRDVVVTDRTGHAVLGLKAADFDVLEDGARRPIVNVAFHRRGGADPPPVETDEEAARAAREPGTRVFAFFLDELHVSPSSADLVRKTIAAFIDEKLEKCDLVGVMTPFDAARSVRFTRDRAFAYGVLDSFQGRKGDDQPKTMHETRARAAAGGSDAQIVKTALRDLALRLGDLQAERPLLVITSEGFPAQTDVRTPLRDLGGLLRTTSRFHITTYSFNPAAVAPDPGAAAEQNTNQETLSWLAAATGGRAVGADQFLHGVARLFHDAEAYYALTYQPAEPDGRFRSLDVRVKRSGVSVLTQRGHWAMRERDWREVEALPGSPALATKRALRRSPLVDAWVGVRREADGVARIAITWEPRRTDGAWPRLVAVKARAADGTPLFEGQVAPLGVATSSRTQLATFAAPPGRIDLDLAILDLQKTVLDTDARFVDVPEFRASPAGVPLLLPVWIVKTVTPRAMQLAAADLQTAPAASRTFHRSHHLLVRVPVFDPRGEGAQVTATLLNQRGVEMRSLDALGVSREDLTDFALPLAWLVPGQYQLEVRAANRRGVATQRVTFRVVG
jgi:VWFA-related protein